MTAPTPLVQVPREPTEAMLTAAAGVGDVEDYLAAVWRAMVEAAAEEGDG